MKNTWPCSTMATIDILSRMKPARFFLTVLAIGTLLASPLTQSLISQARPAGIDSVFQTFWAAKSSNDAVRLVDDVVKTGVSFDEAVRRLKSGRVYTAQKPGVIQLSVKTNGIDHHYAVNVPEGYDPSRRYQVRFKLHGGVGGRLTSDPRGTGEIGALAGAEQFYVLPYAWSAEPWWSNEQITNLGAIVDALKRTYNIDENRVVVAGVSDGGTGAYYIAMRETTPFASFLPLNGFIMVLGNDHIDDGEIFPNNLRNKPLFVINGGKDRLYPISATEPYTKHLISNGVEIEYHPHPEGEHNTAWWPVEKDSFEKFVSGHARSPHPDKLSWETGNLSHNRAHWLIIDKLGAQPSDSKSLKDMNAVEKSDPIAKFASSSITMFIRLNSPGRVDLVRNGNTVQATARGVAAFTLLLSPDQFDFSQPLKVTANGRIVFEGRVQPSVETLMKWAARDNDRTMLYGAELKVDLAALKQ